MITGNFAVNVCEVHTRVDYTLEPPIDTFDQYHFIVYPNMVMPIGKTPPPESTLTGGALINLVYTRVKEQTNLTPQYVGIKVD